MYGRVARPLLDFSERGLGTRLVSRLCGTTDNNTEMGLANKKFMGKLAQNADDVTLNPCSGVSVRR